MLELSETLSQRNYRLTKKPKSVKLLPNQRELEDPPGMQTNALSQAFPRLSQDRNRKVEKPVDNL